MIGDSARSKRLSALYVLIRVLLLAAPTITWALSPVLTLDPFIAPAARTALVTIYIIVLWAFCSVFDCFAVGHARIRELSVWYCLALLFTNFLMWIITFAVAGPPANILTIFVVWVVQTLIGMLLVVTFTKTYYKVYPKRHICAVVSGTDYEKRTLAKIAVIKERFKIEKIVNQHDVDWNDVGHLAPECNTILIGEVDAPYRQILVDDCFRKSRMTIVMPTPTNIIFKGYRPTQISDSFLYVESNNGLSPEQRFGKRIVDIIGALAGIILSAIPMGICAVIIKATDGGPVLYRQERLTRGGEVFDALKLRSMREDAEKDGARLATGDDGRITRIGRFMRRTRLDETPQFFNILRGEMSLVGPRSERLETSEAYTAAEPAFAYRLKVKTGLTGYAQINGRYNTSFEDKLRMDLYYIEHWSLLGDISLMLETVKVLFSSDSTAGFDTESIEAMMRKSHE